MNGPFSFSFSFSCETINSKQMIGKDQLFMSLKQDKPVDRPTKAARSADDSIITDQQRKRKRRRWCLFNYFLINPLIGHVGYSRCLRAEQTNERTRWNGLADDENEGNRSTSFFLVSLWRLRSLHLRQNQTFASHLNPNNAQMPLALRVGKRRDHSRSVHHHAQEDWLHEENKDNGTQNPILLSICVSSHRGSIHRLLTYTYKDTHTQIDRYVGRFSLSFV